MTDRRRFLQAALGSSACLALQSRCPGKFLPLAAAHAQQHGDAARGDRVLVVIQLSGGNDGLNTVIPSEDDEYHRQRFTLAIPKSTVHRLDDYAGLHPELRGLAQLWAEGQLGVVQGVGYPQPNRSHFESMDLWHTAHRRTEQIATGWLGRTLPELEAGDLPALHLGNEDQPLALAAEKIAVPTVSSIQDFRWQGRRDPVLEEFVTRQLQRQQLAQQAASNSDLLNHLHAASQAALVTSKQVESAVGEYDSAIDYPDSRLSRKLRSIAQLLQADLGTRIFYVTLDGFDTHSNQAEAHASLLRELGDAVTAFTRDLQDKGQGGRVATLVFSEFGRRVKENASRGTDHGAAAPLFVIGDAVAGGLLGRYPSLTDLEDGDLKFNVDYRQIYASLLEDWLGVESHAVLGEHFEKLPLWS